MEYARPPRAARFRTHRAVGLPLPAAAARAVLMAGAPVAAATVPPWTYGGLGSCEHVVEAHTTYGVEVAEKVPAQFRSTWGSNDINDNAPGKPGYAGYGWRWCGQGDVAVECEKFCDSLCVPYTP